MKARKATTMLAAAGLAISSVAANAASSLSIARAAPAMSGVSYFQAEDDDDNDGGGSTAVILGVVLVVLIAAAALGGNGNDPSNSP